MLLSFKLTCFPRHITGSAGMYVPMNLPIQHGLQPCPASVSGHAGWEGRMLLAMGGQGPQRELWQHFPRGIPGSPSREHPRSSCYCPWRSCVCPAPTALPSQSSNPSAEPDLDAAAVNVGTTCLEKPQGLSLLKGRRKICRGVPPHLQGFLGHLWNGWLIIGPSEGIRLKHHSNSSLGAGLVVSPRSDGHLCPCVGTLWGDPLWGGLWPTHAHRCAADVRELPDQAGSSGFTCRYLFHQM